MRIIGGVYRGRNLKMPKGIDVRPTQDRVREAVFNMIATVVPGSIVLDLYAGSGAFGIEALSRGASRALFVDNNITSIQAIKANTAFLKESGKAMQVMRSEGLRALSKFEKEGTKFDIIFLDPPYYREMAKNTLLKIDAYDIVTLRGFIIVEHAKKDLLPEKLSTVALFKERRYGDTVISLYRKESKKA
jgi:16S rRNA (guanine966-N2)-methyltransferase